MGLSLVRSMRFADLAERIEMVHESKSILLYCLLYFSASHNIYESISYSAKIMLKKKICGIKPL